MRSATASGGNGAELCSGDMLLEALAACAGVTMRAVATALAIPVEGRVTVEGELDFRGPIVSPLNHREQNGGLRFNHHRLFEDHGRIPPAEFEAIYSRRCASATPAETQTREPA